MGVLTAGTSAAAPAVAAVAVLMLQNNKSFTVCGSTHCNLNTAQWRSNAVAST
jgi:subtilisin family serine protease